MNTQPAIHNIRLDNIRGKKHPRKSQPVRYVGRNEMTKIKVNKIEAAQRQIDTAIILLFDNAERAGVGPR